MEQVHDFVNVVEYIEKWNDSDYRLKFIKRMRNRVK